MKKIAVEKGLKNISDYLTNEGYDVKEFDHTKKRAKNFLNKFDAIVVTGENQNFLGIEDTITNKPIINADGMMPENVKEQIKSTVTWK